MRPYQHTLSAVEVERGRPSWELDDGDFNCRRGSRRPLAARIVPLKPPALLEQLTPREREMLALVTRGLSNAESAERLFVTVPTVNNHVGTGPIKLTLRDMVQAVALAYEHGIVVAGNRG
jgi:DNA-binding CsgD family transcriptional regulator